jgi:uncharacterized protein with von Willebrand factor type A (vWA) domain
VSEHYIAVCDAAASLGRALRDVGLSTSVDQSVMFCRALGEVDVQSRSDVYWAARAVFVHRREHVAAFESVFARFWNGTALFSGPLLIAASESDPRMPASQHGGESTPQFRMEGRSSHLVDGEPTRGTREIPSAPSEDPERPRERRRRGVLAAYSPEEVLPEPQPFRWHDDELAAIRRLAEALRVAAPVRRSRRGRPSDRRGALDLRLTLRHALRSEGEAIHLVWSRPAERPRRLVLLCDVSGSMERYSRALLGALGGVVAAGVRAEAFVFATRLTRITGELAGDDAERALDRARASIADWSGGTRIGAALEEFNRTWGRRGLARGAIVVVVSDGWDRGDPELLAAELGRLRLHARRLVWVNPRPAELDGQPLAVGMRAALPHVDHFVAGHDVRAIEALARLIGGLGRGRPARPQRISSAFDAHGSRALG